ncbi:CoA-binding protein, partial [uncultured Caulobacter sp.]|uniref:acetate--CoA ligase family protein n=1 Tax=uncultured Caulobacter sp. TaxID=158749 RepID=UPI0026058BFA
MSRPSLQPLLNPNGVVVVGGSDRPDTVGRVVLLNLLSQPFAGRIYAVNPKPVALEGVTWAASIDALPAGLDLAVVVTPAPTLPEVVGALGARGVKVAVVITGGVDGGARAAMLAAAEPWGLRIVGPNGLGALAPHAGLNASFARGGAQPGRLAFISQSGALVSSALSWAGERGLGFSGVVSVGDMADADMADLIDLFAADSRTDAILLYIEGVHQAARFLSAARAAARVKPVIAIKAGRTAAARAAALSHTGALAGDYDTHVCAFERAGVVMVETLEDLFDAATVLSATRPRSCERLAIVTNGGGAAVLAVDGLAAIGARAAELAPSSISELDAALPAAWSRRDPVDLLGDADAERYRAALEVVLADPGVDAVLVIHCATAMRSPVDIAEAVTETIAAARARGVTKPVIGCWMGVGERAAVNAIFSAAKLPLFDEPNGAVRGYGYLLAAARARAALMAAPSPRP